MHIHKDLREPLMIEDGIHIPGLDLGVHKTIPVIIDYGFSTVEKDGPRNFNIRVGTANERDQLKPKVQIWHRSSQSWATSIQETQIKEKQ